MKKLFLLTALFSFLFTSSLLADNELSNDDIRAGKLYPFKSAKVVYKKSGMSQGTETLWIDNYGKLQIREIDVTTKVFGFSNTDKSISIVTPEMITTINLKEKTAVRMANPMKDFYENLKTKSDKELEEFKKSGMVMAQQMTGQQEIKPVGTEKILGKKCEIYEITMAGVTSRTWTWSNLSLRTEASMMGNKTLDEATSVEMGIKVPKEKSQIPAGIPIQELPAMGQGQNPFAGLGQQR